MTLGFPGVGGGQPLFLRKWAVTINTIKITELDVNFEIEKSLKDEPNKCTLKVYNMTEEQRSMIEEMVPHTKIVSSLLKAKQKIAARKMATEGIPVKIEAGYAEDNDLDLLWLGDLRTAYSEKDGPDWVTILESGDGEKAYQNARVNVTFGPKTPVDTVFRAIARAMGIKEGNLAEFTHKMQIAGVGRIVPRGIVVQGPARDQMRDWCRQADLEFSIQEGALQFVDKGKALSETAIRLNSDTGLLKSPSVDADGILTVEMQMISGVRPGRLLVLDSARIVGNFKIEKATWHGDSSGDDWKIVCVCEVFDAA